MSKDSEQVEFEPVFERIRDRAAAKRVAADERQRNPAGPACKHATRLRLMGDRVWTIPELARLFHVAEYAVLKWAKTHAGAELNLIPGKSGLRVCAKREGRSSAVGPRGGVIGRRGAGGRWWERS